MASRTILPTLLFLFFSLYVLKTDACNLADLILENGTYSAASDGGTTVGPGESVTACCNNGYVRMGPEKVWCLSTGQFNEDRPTCEDIDECNIGPLLNEYSDGDTSSSSSFVVGSVPLVDDHPLQDKVDQVTCQGRTLLPPISELCHVNAYCSNTKGSYTCTCPDYYIGNGTHCEVDNIPCETPTAPENGYIRILRDRSVDFGCNFGYTLIGYERQSCKRGQWVPDIVRCIDTAIRCPEPVAPLHGRIDHFGGIRVFDHISVVCDEGYDLIGAGIRQCHSNGEWSGRAPRCKAQKTLGDVATDIKKNIIDPFTSYTNSSIMRQNLARSANVPSLGLDLVLAYDRSSSLDETDFMLVVNFAKQLISNFGVSYDEGGTRVAALTFSTTAEMAFNYSDGVDTKEKVFNRLDALKENIGGGTGLKEGLSMVATDIQPTMREGAKHVLFIFTDGQHNTADPFVVARDLKDKGVEIFAVGVGRQINPTALQQIASYPPSSHFFYIRTFQDLQTLTQLVNSSEIDYKPCGEAGNVLAGDDHQANEKAWPWLSIIHRNSSIGWEMMCSGTLLCQQWVLTTSSCFANIPDSEVIEEVLVTFGEDSLAMPEEITVTVTLGEYNVSLGEGCEQTIEVDRIILHDQYDLERLHDYDIALLHLREPVELNSCVRTICLPSGTDTPNDPTVVGWGTASGIPENAHDVPLQYPMPFTTQAKCHRVNYEYNELDVTDRMFCAGEREGIDVRCEGDNGSPLMYKRSGDEKWAVRGISTKGEKCSQYNRYGIFTRVDQEFTQWINMVTDDCFSNHIPTETVL